jgi:hypothetical protein
MVHNNPRGRWCAAGKNDASKLPLAISAIDDREAKPADNKVMSAEIAGSNFSQ